MLKTIPLKHGRSLIAGYSMAAKKTNRWIVFLSEAASDFRHGSKQELETLVGRRIARHFNFLVINKPGLSPFAIDRKAFEESARRSRRIEDALATLKLVVPKGHRIHLVGYSEGAYLAPQVARRDKRTETVSMIGGGTRGWLKEELSTAPPRERREYERKVKDVYRNPRSLEKWNGFSYATWYSYRADNTLQALRNLRLPTLAILGARDRVIDLRSTIVDLVLVSERQPTQIHVFGDCGHYFTKHWTQVESVLGRFLKDAVLK
jgi:pimeloyl-ACP methyl ester carboxylesterase